MREWVKVRGSGTQRVRAPQAQPLWGGEQPPGAHSPRRPRPPPCWERLASGTLRSPTQCTPPPGHGLHIQTHSGTHPETHKDSHWLVARHPRPQMCTHCIPDAHSHTIGAHTHIPSLTHTHSWSHSFRGRGNTGHARRHNLPWMFAVTPRTPSRHTSRPGLANTAPQVGLRCAELFAGSLRCSSRKSRVRCPGGTC